VEYGGWVCGFCGDSQNMQLVAGCKFPSLVPFLTAKDVSYLEERETGSLFCMHREQYAAWE